MKVLICLSCWVASVLTQLNLAGKPLSASSVYEGFPPEHAIDGRLDTSFESDYSATGHAYWQIDLENNHHVKQITILFPSFEGAVAENRTISLSSDSSFDSAHTFLCGQSIGEGATTFTCQRLFTVRYVRVSTDRPPLSLIEIKVYVEDSVQSLSEVNLAGKPLSASSVHEGFPPERAIDGRLDTSFESDYTPTGHAYWQIDLENNNHVKQITISFPKFEGAVAENRTISLSSDSSFDSAHTFLCGQSIGEGTTTFTCQRLFTVRYVRVSTDLPPLSLIEIKVYVEDSVQSVSEVDITGKPVTQSSTIPQHPAVLAVDGNFTTMSVTESGSTAYWILNLEQPYTIRKILIAVPDFSNMVSATIHLFESDPSVASGLSYLCGEIANKGNSTFDCSASFLPQYITVYHALQVMINELQVFEEIPTLGSTSVTPSSIEPSPATVTTTRERQTESTTSNMPSSPATVTTTTPAPTTVSPDTTPPVAPSPVTSSPASVATTSPVPTPSSSVNLTGKPLSVSSVHEGFPPELAIDGSSETYFVSDYTPTGHAYWQIDLENNHHVKQITIFFPFYGREMAENRTISLSSDSSFDSAHTFLCGQSIGEGTTTFTCQRLFTVRYVRVSTDLPPLSLNEIKVYVEDSVQSVSEGTTSNMPSSPATVTTTTPVPTTVSPDTTPPVVPSPVTSSPASVATTTPVPTPSSSGAAYKAVRGHTLATPTDTMTAPSATTCSIWCLQSPGCTAFSFNKALLVNNCKIGASQSTVLSSGWTANIKRSTLEIRRVGYSCS
ncbi:location of vulva defective 1-like [Haliotis rufescens]|uniref:location of vulva defective 1-like n=1 Tax=Haliotis rufescens TaxID=6454 RepID=UPI00201E9724|nr:location of vulva defective 1-like [Haliotis rufescens]